MKKKGKQNEKKNDYMEDENNEPGGTPEAACFDNRSGNRRHSRDRRIMYYRLVVVRCDERQPDLLYYHTGDEYDNEGTGHLKRSDSLLSGESGSIGDFLAVGICMIFLSLLLVRYMDSVGLINEKAQVNQFVRQYILRMETVGRLTAEDRTGLCSSLQQMGVSDINLDGTTFGNVGYGEMIVLHVQGKLRGEYAFEVRAVSTAKY